MVLSVFGHIGLRGITRSDRNKEQSDQSLDCLPIRLHLLDALLYGKITIFFMVNTTKFSVCELLRNSQYLRLASELSISNDSGGSEVSVINETVLKRGEVVVQRFR